MPNLRTRLLIVFISLVAFAGPFAAVVAIKNIKQAEKSASEEEAYAAEKKGADAARYQYYLDLADRRNNSKTSMAQAKAEYERLLKDQPDLIKQGQHTVTQTTVEPVTTQQTITVPVTPTTKPKTSTKTKSS